MKRTREKTEKMEEEEIRSQMFDSEVTPAMRDAGSRIVLEPSYVPIENLIFGRLAFKGMNQEIEAMMAEKVETLESDEKDVSDSNMASCLSSNIAKKYGTKRDASGKSKINKSNASITPETSKLLSQTSNFLAQVRAETDQAKKSKPGFLKPSDD